MHSNCYSDNDGDNFASTSTAYTSSTNDNFNASNAIDGVDDYTVANGRCSETLVEVDPWWISDIGEERRIQTTVLAFSDNHNG